MNELAKPLTYIFKYSLETGQVPHDWRHARVTPILYIKREQKVTPETTV